jgi:hypothetical protein
LATLKQHPRAATWVRSLSGVVHCAWHSGRVSLIGSEFYVELDELVCRREVLGSSLKLQRGEVRYLIEFPDRPDAFRFDHVAAPRIQGKPPDPRDYDRTVALVEQGGDMVDVRLVRIVANVESSLCATSFDRTSSEDQKAHDRLFHDLTSGALQLARDLCDWVRIIFEQVWIEPSGRYPRIVNAIALVDLTANRDFGSMIAPAGMVRIVDEDTVLDAAGLAKVRESLEQGAPAPDELFLSEARYLLRSQQVTGAERATLLAAIALEVRTKRALQAIADAAQLPLVDLLLENPRDWSLAAHALFHKALPVVAGYSLGKEHADLSKRVQQLFTSRNALAHRGATIEASAAAEHVETAREAFAFLSALEEQLAT